MKYVGLNKKLLDRRKELDYSVLEACIRLDISKRKLYLIEHGYIKVKNSELQARFIRKYKLEEDFFTKDELLYPTPIENPEKEKKVTKLGKFIGSWKFKVICLVLLGGFIAMGSCGLTMTPKLTKDTKSFFSPEFNQVKDIARSDEYGARHPYYLSDTASLCCEDYYALESDVQIQNGKETSSWYSGVNFIGNKNDQGVFNDENLTYTFYNGSTMFDEQIFGLGKIISYYEARYSENLVRFQYYGYFLDSYDPENPFENYCSYISADYNKKTNSFTYNLVYAMSIFSFDDTPIAVDSKSLEYAVFTSIFESKTEEFEKSLTALFDKYLPVTNVTYETFNSSLSSGIASYTSYQNLTSGLTLWGLILSILFLAFLAFSFIKGAINKFRESILKEEIDKETVPFDEEISRDDKVKPLPKNKWPTPFIPEMVIRILVLVISVMSSMGIFYIFQSVMMGDVVGLIENVAFKAEIASLATLAMMLLFFTKLDIQQSKKNTFLVNYILFFLGLVFYFVLLIIQFTLSNSTSALANIAKDALPYLPGNIVWGILAFNLLSSILFSTPKFKNNSKVKIVLYRSLIIIPLGYMLVSSLYQIGNKAWGWSWPFAATSLLFNKALILTAFTVLYCLVVFIYKAYTKKKYGENAAIYQNGNRYFFIKNLLVCGVIAILGIIDIAIGKAMGNNNPLGAGGNYVILFIIPFVLFYHPHMGKRNAKWDLAFAGLYAISMVLGLLLVASNLSSYIMAF